MDGQHNDTHEDPDRLPDGIPHIVVGLTAGYAMLMAITLLVAWASDRPLLGAFAAIITPAIVWQLVKKSQRERDVVHPSR